MIPRTSNTQCAPYTDRIVSYCHAGDPVCANGGDISQHLNYIQANGGDAAAFIASKVR